MTKQIIASTRRGKENDCFGYCIGCPQSDIPFVDSERSRDMEYVFCGLPPLHSVTFSHPRGRGKRRVRK